MRNSILILAAIALSAPASAQYFYTDTFTSINTSVWTVTAGAADPTPTASGLTECNGNGGDQAALIHNSGWGYHEVKASVNLSSASTNGGIVLYLSAQPGALYGPTGLNYIGVSVKYYSGYLWMEVLMSNGGQQTFLGSYGFTGTTNAVVRAVRTPTGVRILVQQGSTTTPVWIPISGGPSGYFPGIGLGSVCLPDSITQVQLGMLETTPPDNIPQGSLNASAAPTRVDLTWSAVSDNSGGSGFLNYEIWRNGVMLGTTTATNYADLAVSPSTNYTYTIKAMDFHGNVNTGTSISVSTRQVPPSTIPADPRQVGVRPLGAYWGASGENIDMRTGNLNFTMPLIRPMSRNGSGATFALNYNSQIWRKDGSSITKLGYDVGYGFGWRLMAGSILPVWLDPWTFSYYLYTDSTGAQYRLNVNNGGYWESKEGVYVIYDGGNNRLRFQDGSYWQMDNVTGGGEPDAGTRYPTQIVDSNGNIITLTYLGATARIQYIADVRGNPAYTFNYDGTNHLTGINNGLATAERYTFSYHASQSIKNPFGDAIPPFGTAHLLWKISTDGLPLSNQFAYDGRTDPGAPPGETPGELTKVILPYGGELRWDYRSFTHLGAKTVREVYQRHLLPSSGATPLTYPIAHADNPGTITHAWSHVYDASNLARRAWVWDIGETSPTFGLQTIRNWRSLPSAFVLRQEEFTYALDSIGRPYISATNTLVDINTPTPKTMRVEQFLDAYGNSQWQKIYHWKLASESFTLARTYTNTFITDSAYTSRFLRNLLTSSTVTDGTNTRTLVTNSYDGYSLTNRTGLTQHDTTNYGTSCTWRGNVTGSWSYGSTAGVARHFDITGTVTDSTTGTVTVANSPTSNNAVPGTITLNGDSSTSHTMLWNASLGLTQDTGPNGATTYIGYDSFARPSGTTSPHGASTTFTYDDTAHTKTATTNGRWTRETSDGLGRVIKVESGNGGTTVSIVETEYGPCACSPLGKVKKVSQPYAPNATKYWTEYTYDALGRTTKVLLPDGQSKTEYAYLLNTVTVTDPALKWKTFEQDALGNLVKVTEPNPAGGSWDTTYTYNLTGQLTGVSMPRPTGTQTRTFFYNDSGQLTYSINPENGRVNNYYNSDGTLNYFTDAKGQKTSYIYDTFRRVTQVQRYPNGSTEDTAKRVTYYYDTNPIDGSYSQYPAGRLTAVQYSRAFPGDTYNITFSEQFSYTQAGLPIRKKLTMSKPNRTPANLEAQYVYDNEGRRTSMKYPDWYPVYGDPIAGISLSYTYDSMGRLSGIPGWASNVQYNAAGQMKTFGGENRDYNANGQLTRITGSLDLEYRYSATQNNGRITHMKDFTTGEEVAYQYDALNRLASAQTPGTTQSDWGMSFVYDGFGNRTQQNATKGVNVPSPSVTIDSNTNRVVGVGYDNNGNELPPGCAGGCYDVANRYVSPAMIGTGIGYAPDNKRIWQRKYTGTYQGVPQYEERVHFFGLDGKLMGSYKVNFPTESEMKFEQLSQSVYFGSRLISEGGQGIVPDRLGSTVRHFPYGEERGTTAQDRTKFATYWRDEQTGWDYADQRFYNTALGRFSTPDPSKSARLADPSTWNKYSYVGGDPTNRADPRGLDWVSSSDGMCVPEDYMTAYSATLNGYIHVVNCSNMTPVQEAPLAEEIFVHSPDGTLLYGFLTTGGVTFINWDEIFALSDPSPVQIFTLKDLLEFLLRNPVLVALAFEVATGDADLPPSVRCPDKDHFNDPTKPPHDGWIWKGTGPVGSSEGNWVNPNNKESLHPDLMHPPGKDPHWDYKDPAGIWWECYEDGRVIKKK